MRLVWLLLGVQRFIGTLPTTLAEGPDSLKLSIDFAKAQGLQWEYQTDGTSLSLAITGFKRDAHEASRALVDKITIWPVEEE